MTSVGHQFYKTVSDNKRTESLKARLEKAEEWVSVKRQCDVLKVGRHHINDPANTYQVFSRQSEALKRASECDDLRVFSYELDRNGRRNFIVAHPEIVWTLLEAKPKDGRHFYEVIGEGDPCKLYFDLEFSLKVCSVERGAKMLAEFKNFLTLNLKKHFVLLGRIEIVDLDSTSVEKFSRHLIVNLWRRDDNNNKQLFFKDNFHVGQFVRHLIDEMKKLVDDFLLVFDHDTKTFVDESVYTKNRNFRTYLSSKFGKMSTLTLAEKTSDDEKHTFLNSLVTFCNGNQSDELLEFVVGKFVGKNKRAANITDDEKVVVKSPFPEIDAYMADCAEEFGGYLRKVSSSPCGFFYTYEFGNFRFCRNVNRWHKSNNIKYVVDLKNNRCFQTCHDPDCRNFRSNYWHLPEHYALPWQEILISDMTPDASNFDAGDETSNRPLAKKNKQVDDDDDDAEDDFLLKAAEHF